MSKNIEDEIDRIKLKTYITKLKTSDSISSLKTRFWNIMQIKIQCKSFKEIMRQND